MAEVENHGLPPEVHIDHWNEATNIYMVVIVVSLWFFVYLRKNRGRIARMLVRKQETEEQENQRKEELKQVRLRQQLDMYYKARKWDQAKQKQERSDHHHIDMVNI